MLKNVDKWIGGYLLDTLRRRRDAGATKMRHILLTVCDHFEPDWGGADRATQSRRVDRWVDEWPKVCRAHEDIDGMPPKHTFFFPVEVYDRAHVQKLAMLCRSGFGEVEIHLHHDGDTEESLRERLEMAKTQLSSHGLLGRDQRGGGSAFGFVHGNWALNNSGRAGRWCGVNDEARVLRDAGCYADFTFPSAPHFTQPRMINRLYYGGSDPQRPGGHHRGIEVAEGKPASDALMLITGPLALDWRRRVRGVFPRIENGDLTKVNPPVPVRVDLWIRQNICVQGRADWIFVKLHTHGAREDNAEMLLGEAMEQMYDYFETAYNDKVNYALHYVSAREMFNIAKAAECGKTGDPGEYRDYLISPPTYGTTSKYAPTKGELPDLAQHPTC